MCCATGIIPRKDNIMNLEEWKKQHAITDIAYWDELDIDFDMFVGRPGKSRASYLMITDGTYETLYSFDDTVDGIDVHNVVIRFFDMTYLIEIYENHAFRTGELARTLHIMDGTDPTSIDITAIINSDPRIKECVSNFSADAEPHEFERVTRIDTK